MPEYIIRPALPEHIPQLAAVEQAAATLFPTGTIPDAIRGDSVPVPLLEEAAGAGNLWAALDGSGRAIGFALLCVEEGCALLAEMDVMPEHGGRGIGRKLIAEAARKAREDGHAALYLTTFSHVPWNMPFYERVGFSLLPEGKAPPALESALQAERARGMEHRVAMRMALIPAHDETR
jgi:Predicted acetyltransferase